MDTKAWMADIDDAQELLRLNLCGTHDCVTQYVQLPHISRCQDKTIYEQLCLGVRALDIRVAPRGDRLKMVHGIAKAFPTPNRLGAQMDLADVLAQCYRFLAEQPSETIVFQFKNDSGKAQERCFSLLYHTYIRQNADKWFLKNCSPTLGTCRGKLLLLRRCRMDETEKEAAANSGIDFSGWVEQDEAVPTPLPLSTGGRENLQFLIQDRYKYKPQPRWTDCIKPFLDSMTPFDGTYIINYLSTAGGVQGPYRNAQYINPLFLAYPLQEGVYYGTIYTDFPTADLTKKIIATNFEASQEDAAYASRRHQHS